MQRLMDDSVHQFVMTKARYTSQNLAPYLWITFLYCFAWYLIHRHVNVTVKHNTDCCYWTVGEMTLVKDVIGLPLCSHQYKTGSSRCNSGLRIRRNESSWQFALSCLLLLLQRRQMHRWEQSETNLLDILIHTHTHTHTHTNILNSNGM